LKALYTFSFEPNDWEQFHGRVPVFGSLFTLTLLALPFLKNTRRLWGLYLAGHVAVFVWYSIHHQDRYLQAILPWMAAATASALILTWRAHWVARIPLAGLVGLQLVWGSDAYFIPSHSMLHVAPLKNTIDFISSGYRKEYASRLKPFGGWPEVGRVLDKNNHVVLLHDDMDHLGLRTRFVAADPALQAGIDYASQRSPRAVWQLLEGMGVTHMVWSTSRARHSIASDLVFFDFATRYSRNQRVISGLTLAELPVEPPTDRAFGDTLAWLACDGRLKAGFYHLRELAIYPGDNNPCGGFPKPFEPSPAPERMREWLQRADFIVYDPSCHPPLPTGIETMFELIGRQTSAAYWVNRRSP
jgi:hypothetical protein